MLITIAAIQGHLHPERRKMTSQDLFILREVNPTIKALDSACF